MSASCEATPSRIAASTTWPRPDRCRSTRASRMPIARKTPPPPISPMRLSGGTGGPSSGPIASRAPVSARKVRSWPAAFASGPSCPPAGHAPIDQLRIFCECGVRPKAKPFHDARPEAFDENVGFPDEAQAQVYRFRLFQIERNSAGPDPRARWPRETAPPHPAADPQHIRAEVRQKHAGVRCRPKPGEFDHANAGQRWR